MKAKKIILLALVFSLCFSVFVSADTEMRWYIKRNGHSKPELDKSQEIIYNYSGCYLDNNRSEPDAEKVLYLTFDVGYENGNVEKILDVMKEEDVQGAFFVLSHFVNKNTDLVMRMIEEGHLVCNHTANHINLSKCSVEDAERSIRRLEEIYTEKTGEKLAPFFRFPEGAYNEETLELVESMGYKSVFWSMAYADWDDKRQPNEDKAINLLLNNTHNGAIILLHPTSTTNVNILPKLISEWKNQGYRFASLNELK